MAEIQLLDVSKTFPGGVRAVAGVQMRAAPGELHVLIGPSGCGKTTTLRLLAGLERPTSGEIRFDGNLMNDAPPRRRNVAMVFQEDSLLPHLTVRQNILLKERLKRSWIRWFPLGRLLDAGSERPPATATQQTEESKASQAAEIAQTLGMHLLDRYPAEISGGEKQRTALARAIVQQPAVFLLDEPLSQLDPPLRDELAKRRKAVATRTQTTMIYVTHDPAEAMSLGDRISVMDGGCLVQTGRPVDVYDKPANRRTAGLLGAPPMNFIDGTLTGEDGGVFAASGVWRPWRFSMPLSDWPTGAVGRKAVLGVRPEHVHVHGEPPPGSVGNLAKIVMVEALGDSTILRLQTATNDSDDNVTTTLACRMPARVNLSEGMQAAVSIDAQRCCLFCQETGERLPRRDETT